MTSKGFPLWERFEKDVQRILGLRQTLGSGNQWHDVSDGVTHPDDPYKLMVDCKHTKGSSYILKVKMLQQWWEQATNLGYHFALPVRFEGNIGSRKEWVTITLDDYEELVDNFRTMNGMRRCGSRYSGVALLCCRREGHFDRHDNGVMEWTNEELRRVNDGSSERPAFPGPS